MPRKHKDSFEECVKEIKTTVDEEIDRKREKFIKII